MFNNKYLLGCVALAGIAGASQFWLKPIPLPPPAKSVDRSYYYRLNVKLTHRDEHFDMNIIVQCYGDKLVPNSTAQAVRWPRFYVERTKNNHAIGVRTTLGCDGHTTANGGAPADLLPSIYWYPDADDMTFAIMYATEDAYDNPLSQLKFHGATMHTATAAEHNAFIDEAKAAEPKKLVFVIGGGERRDPSSAVDVDEIIANGGRPPKPNWSSTQTCYGMLRLKLSDEARVALRAYWPAHKPKYWAPNGELLKQAMEDLSWSRTEFDEYGRRKSRSSLASGKFYNNYGFRIAEPGTDGLQTRNQGGRLLRLRDRGRPPTPEVPYPLHAEVYPVLHSAAFGQYKSADRDSNSLWVKIDRQGGATKGFAYCQTGLPFAFKYKTNNGVFTAPFESGQGIVGSHDRQRHVEATAQLWGPLERLLPNFSNRVIDEFVDDEKIERTPANIGFGSLQNGWKTFFENDEYVIINEQYK
jgi:hypothetical protein